MNTKELILKYFNSWQSPTNFDELADCLSEDFSIDGGLFKFDDKAAFMAMLRQSESPWDEVKLVASHFTDEGGTIIYEGHNIAAKQKMRVAELLRVVDGKISRIDAVIAHGVG